MICPSFLPFVHNSQIWSSRPLQQPSNYATRSNLPIRFGTSSFNAILKWWNALDSMPVLQLLYEPSLQLGQAWQQTSAFILPYKDSVHSFSLQNWEIVMKPCQS
jgi:hypothetical protein